MRKKEIIELEEKAQFFNIFRGYNLTDAELKWAWRRYLEVKENA